MCHGKFRRSACRCFEAAGTTLQSVGNRPVAGDLDLCVEKLLLRLRLVGGGYGGIEVNERLAATYMISGWMTRICDLSRKIPRLQRPLATYARCPSHLFEKRAISWRAREFTQGPHLTRSQTILPSSLLEKPAFGLVQSDAQRTTIYALSTPPGKAGVAVVRVSGPDSLDVWRSMVSTKSKATRHNERTPEPWRMYRCDVVDPQTGELIDSGLAVYFKGPCHPVNV